MKIKPFEITYSDYLKVVNQHNEHHPSSAYQFDTKKLNEFHKPNEYADLINQFTIMGIQFELREKKIDRHQFDYVARDKEDNILRDEQGTALLMTLEEKKVMIKNQFCYEHAIIRSDTKEIVAETSDEWGCLLITTASEYRGFGLGTRLLEKNQERHPLRHTGGFTPSGQNLFRTTYQRQVAKALGMGHYRKAYLAGTYTFDEIKEILVEAGVVAKYVEQEKEKYQKKGVNPDFIEKFSRKKINDNNIDLSMKNPGNWLLHCDGNFAILYDKAIFTLLKERERYEHFIEKAIKGYVYVGGVYDQDSIPRLFRLHAENEKIRCFMTELMLNESIGSKIRMTKDDISLMRNHLGDKLFFKKIPRSELFETSVLEPTLINTKVMTFVERKTRASLDSYDEAWHQIQEIAYSLGEDAFERENNKEKTKAENSFAL